MQIKKTTADKPYIKQLLELLKPLDNVSKYRIQKLLQNVDKNFVLKICEVIYNILHGTIPIKASDKKKLKKYRFHLHKLCKRNHSIKSKTQILQHGGGAFLSALIPAAITGISSLLGSLTSK